MVKTKRTRKGNSAVDSRVSVISFIIFTALYIVFLMWLYGTVNHYIQPIHVGAGQYFDVGVAIIIIAIAIYTAIASYIFNVVRNEVKR